MATPYEIPLTSAPQMFSISLSGVSYTLTVTWCPPAECWTLAIADGSGTPLLSGVPLVTGADLLAQYAYLGIPGQLIVQTDDDTYAVPTYENLGTRGHLYYIA